jgi:hypothetical protein
MTTTSRGSNDITGNEITPHRETEAKLTYPPSSAPHVEISTYCISMPEVVRSSPMCEENQAQHENRHEKIILSDHDALLLLFPLTKHSVPLWAGV